MTNNRSFNGYTIVACGTLRRELNQLRDTGFLDADKILYTTPGLHEHLDELERQLRKQIKTAKKYSNKIIVVYGSKCYLDPTNPKDINQIIQSVAGDIRSVNATHVLICWQILMNVLELLVNKTFVGCHWVGWSIRRLFLKIGM